MKAAQTAPSTNVSYSSSVQSRPRMCTISVQTDPLPAASATPASLSTTATTTTTAATTSTTSQASTSKSQYSAAVSNTQNKREKTDKSNNNLNFTKLERHRPSHVAATPAPSRKSTHARSLSSSSGELRIDEDMEVSSRKDRERSPGSDNARKKTRKGRHSPHS